MSRPPSGSRLHVTTRTRTPAVLRAGTTENPPRLSCVDASLDPALSRGLWLVTWILYPPLRHDTGGTDPGWGPAGPVPPSPPGVATGAPPAPATSVR